MVMRAKLLVNWDPKKKLRGVKKAIREAVMAGLRYWHEKFRPRHFTSAGAQMYGYPEPTARYRKRKLKRKGHDLPFVYHGRLRDAAERAEFKATQKRGRVIISTTETMTRDGRNYATMRRRKWGRAMADFLTKVTDEEVQAIAHVVMLHLKRWLAEKTGVSGGAPAGYGSRLGRWGAGVARLFRRSA